MNNSTSFCLFYGSLFIAFGLGLLLSELIEGLMFSGIWFMIIGFILILGAGFIGLGRDKMKKAKTKKWKIQQKIL